MRLYIVIYYLGMNFESKTKFWIISLKIDRHKLKYYIIYMSLKKINYNYLFLFKKCKII